jgi:hypothetical protein
LVCHAPQCRVWALSLCFLYFCLVEHNPLNCFYEKFKSFGFFGFSLSCPSFAWAALIIKFFRTCPPSVGCDPSQGYFQKSNRLNMGLQRIYFSLVKGLSKMAFPHLKLMHWGSISLAFMRVCKVIYSFK